MRSVKALAALVISLPLALGLPGTAQAFIGIDELFSNADGSVQFIVLNTVESGRIAGTVLATSGPPGTGAEFTIPSDFADDAVNRSFLVATRGFADLMLVKPDFIVPNGFLPLRAGRLSIDRSDVVYDHLPTDGFNALWSDPDADRTLVARAWAANFAGDSAWVVLPSPAPNRSGLWWSAPAGSEPGWGVVVDHQGDVVVAAWATYAADGSPTWFVMPRGALYVPSVMDDIAPNTTWQGTLYRTTGPSFTGTPRRFSATPVGAGGFHFPRLSENGVGTLYWSVGAGAISKAITRQVFGDPPPECLTGGEPPTLPNYQGLWWNSSQPGWALYIADQGALFAVWLTYDILGNPTWFSVQAITTTPFPDDTRKAFAGTIYRATGPSFTTPFDASKVTTTAVGTATLTFTSRTQGTFAFTLDDIAVTTPIEREVFADAPTFCD